jgi:ribosomal protein S18 acetylase RimI-like enzyme
VYALIQEAFGEWDQHIPLSFDQWRLFTVGRETFDARVSPVAVDGASGAIVGVALCLTYDEEEGYVHQLAVRRTHRNRGIARALLVTAFRGFHELGRRVVTLGTDSRTGALPMYERVGMCVRRSYTAYGKEVGPSYATISQAAEVAGPVVE